MVVNESLKALFNIFLCYPNLNEKWETRDLWEKALNILEKQMDCSVCEKNTFTPKKISVWV